MDRAIDQKQQNKGKIKSIGKWMLLFALLVLAYLGVRKILSTNINLSEFRTTTVESGPVNQSVTASGIIIPSFEEVLTSPISGAIEKVHTLPGTAVEKGDELLQLDKEFTQLEYEQLKDQLTLRENNVLKLKLEFDKNVKDLKLDDEMKLLQISSLEAALKDIKHLQEVGGATIEDVEEAELLLKISKLEKKKLENELEFREASLEKDKQNLELEVEIQKKKLAELSRKLRETNVTAKRRGVVTWVNEKLGSQVQVGDPLVRIAQLDQFRIEGSSSDRNAEKIIEGMPVMVRINRKKLNGIVSSILPSVENNTVKFVVALDDPSDEALRPNMRVEIFMITDQKESAIRVVNGPAFKGNSIEKIFVLLNHEEAIRKDVRIGLSNIEYVEILSGLDPGDKIIVSNMDAYEHLETIKLKQ